MYHYRYILSFVLSSKNGPSHLLATPQQRRAQLGESSVSKSKMSIENYLAKIDAYRYSTLKVVYSMPFSIQRRDHRLTKNLQEDYVLRRLIITSLEEHKIQSTHFDFVNLSKPFYPNCGDIQVPTLRIYMDVACIDRNVACSEVCIYESC